jgi:hypothetical protein
LPPLSVCDSAKAFQKEAQRRIDLHLANSPNRHKAGNRIRVIGHSNNPAYEGLGDIVVTPGSYINVIDMKPKADFRFFVHAPFRKEIDSKLAERNDTSVVLQACFGQCSYRGELPYDCALICPARCRGVLPALSISWNSEQSRRTHNQNGRHHQVNQRQRDLRQDDDAESL